MADRRVLITVRTWSEHGRYALALDTPRGDWPLEELFQVARDTAEASGVLNECTDVLAVQFSWRQCAQKANPGRLETPLAPAEEPKEVAQDVPDR